MEKLTNCLTFRIELRIAFLFLSVSLVLSLSLFLHLVFLALLTGPKIIVRTEEVLIVGLVLILWVGAIMLFFNRWGKIRMLEPYQPKFQQQHRSSCPLVDLDAVQAHQVSTSKFKCC